MNLVLEKKKSKRICLGYLYFGLEGNVVRSLSRVHIGLMICGSFHSINSASTLEEKYILLFRVVCISS